MIEPTKEDLLAAVDKKVADVIAPNLRVLFCGINPGLYTAAVGHHFARPGNRFWPTLFASGFTNRLFSPDEDGKLLEIGIGLTNLVERASLSAKELSKEELIEGSRKLVEKIKIYQPSWLGVVGISAYKAAFFRPQAKIGPQKDLIGQTKIWLLPNPSGLNAHYTPAQLAELFSQLRLAAHQE